MTLSDLIAAVTKPLPKLLPMVHATKAQYAIEILKKGQIDPRRCQVFAQDLSYFFYAKNSYKVDGHTGTTSPSLAPVVFIFNTPDTFRIGHAFDTGAADCLLYKRFFALKSPMEQINIGKIGSTGQTLRGAVSVLYGTNRAYLTEQTTKLDKITVPSTAFDLQQLIALLRDPAWRDDFDERRRAFEIQIDAPLKVNESTLTALVYPKTYDDDPSFSALLTAMPKVKRITYPGHHAQQAQRAQATATNEVENLMLRMI